MNATEGKGECVLNVDDEEALVFLATRALTRMGYGTVCHTDATAALEDFVLGLMHSTW